MFLKAKVGKGGGGWTVIGKRFLAPGCSFCLIFPGPTFLKATLSKSGSGVHDTAKQQGPRNFYHYVRFSQFNDIALCFFSLEDLFPKEKLKDRKNAVSSAFLVYKLLINYEPISRKFWKQVHYL